MLQWWQGYQKKKRKEKTTKSLCCLVALILSHDSKQLSLQDDYSKLMNIVHSRSWYRDVNSRRSGSVLKSVRLAATELLRDILALPTSPVPNTHTRLIHKAFVLGVGCKDFGQPTLHCLCSILPLWKVPMLTVRSGRWGVFLETRPDSGARSWRAAGLIIG